MIKHQKWIPLVAALAGGSFALASRPAAADFGIEIEFNRIVTNQHGNAFPPDTDLLDPQQADPPFRNEGGGYFKMVTDIHGGQSNLELVTNHFDEQTPAENAALQTLGYQLTHMRSLYTHIYQLPAGDWPQQSLTPFRLLAIQNNDDRRLGNHFTIGIPLSEMATAMHYFEGAYQHRNQLDQQRTQEAIVLANNIAQASGKGDKVAREIGGYVALVYTQVAAFHDSAIAGDVAAPKNRPVVLSRVNLGALHDALSLEARTWVDQNRNNILHQFPIDVSQIIHTTVGAQQRVFLLNYARSALGVKADGQNIPYPNVAHVHWLPNGNNWQPGQAEDPIISQTRVFGKMRIVAPDVRQGVQLIPVEIRGYANTRYDWDGTFQLSQTLLRYSRQLLQTAAQRH